MNTISFCLQSTGKQDGFGIRILRDGRLISGRWIEGKLNDGNRVPMTNCEVIKILQRMILLLYYLTIIIKVTTRTIRLGNRNISPRKSLSLCTGVYISYLPNISLVF